MMKPLPISKPVQFSLVNSRKSDRHKKRYHYYHHKRALALKFHDETSKDFAGNVCRYILTLHYQIDVAPRLFILEEKWAKIG